MPKQSVGDGRLCAMFAFNQIVHINSEEMCAVCGVVGKPTHTHIYIPVGNTIFILSSTIYTFELGYLFMQIALSFAFRVNVY